jgi:nitrite reductase (NADH) large subunit
MAKQRVVVIGSGLAGASVVQALLARPEADQLRVEVLGAEPQGAFDRADLPRLLADPTATSEIVRFDPAWFRERSVSFHGGARARLVDRVRRQVHADGLMLVYDKVVFATGSAPYLPGIRNLLLEGGKLHPGVFTFRSLEDVAALDAALVNARSVAVVGGGPMGLEIASALAQRGCHVHLLHLSTRLMSGQLDDAAARILKAEIEALGAELHLGKRVVSVLGDPLLAGLAMSDGSTLACDVVVLAAGFQPETWLAFQSGLTVERAIVVDGQMRSPDDPNCYALGECAQWRASIHGTREQIAEQAEVIAEHLTTRHSERRYLGVRQASLFHVLGMPLATMGSPESRDGDDVAQLSEPGRSRYKKVVMHSGRLVSAILLGDLRQADSLNKLYRASAPLTAEEQSRLFDLWIPGGDAPSDTDDY